MSAACRGGQVRNEGCDNSRTRRGAAEDHGAGSEGRGLAYNALVQSWPENTRLAQRAGTHGQEQQLDLFDQE